MVVVLVHTPLVQVSPLGHSLFVVHDVVQAPRTQVSPDGHTVPHVPQSLASVCVSTHSLPQSVNPHPDDAVQTPPWHTCPEPH